MVARSSVSEYNMRMKISHSRPRKSSIFVLQKSFQVREVRKHSLHSSFKTLKFYVLKKRVDISWIFKQYIVVSGYSVFSMHVYSLLLSKENGKVGGRRVFVAFSLVLPWCKTTMQQHDYLLVCLNMISLFSLGSIFLLLCYLCLLLVRIESCCGTK